MPPAEGPEEEQAAVGAEEVGDGVEGVVDVEGADGDAIDVVTDATRKPRLLSRPPTMLVGMLPTEPGWPDARRELQPGPKG